MSMNYPSGPNVGNPTYTGFQGVTSLAGFPQSPSASAGSPSSQGALHASAPCKVHHTTKKSAGHCGAAKHKGSHKAKHPAHHRMTLHNTPSYEQYQEF